MPIRTIQQSFNKAFKTYDLHCHVQRQVCQLALQHVKKISKTFPIIADMACGTGVSTALLCDKIDYDLCVGLDIADQLLLVAKKKGIPQVDWIHSCFNAPPLAIATLDLLLCNMGLQWSPSLHDTLNIFSKLLNKRGLIVLTVPVDGHFAELVPPYKPSLMSYQQYLAVFKAHQYHLINDSLYINTEKFCSSLKALKSIKSIGANYPIHHAPLHRQPHFSKKQFSRVFYNHQASQLTHRIAIYIMSKQS